jgi:peroxiredoxin Q/BCP
MKTLISTNSRVHYQDSHNTWAELIGTISDSKKSLERFAFHYKLPFVLLSDAGEMLRNRSGVSGDLPGLIPGRVTYILDKQSIIKHIFNSPIHFGQHVSEALPIHKELK